MAAKDWRISGVEISSCNCAYGCPCQFNALPTHGNCEAVFVMHITSGHFGDVKLDGLKWGQLLKWPGPVHEGNGHRQVFGQETANAEQRRAIETIASGSVSDEGTFFQIFAAMTPHVEPPVWRRLEFEHDVDARHARVSVDELLDVTIEPIRNPITGAEHRALVELPQGFEYRRAEYASGAISSRGPIAMKHSGTHAHLASVGWDAHRRVE
ncbi:MAG TPA: DUF1326 domain-containing protein [Candidatus Binatia bacterium]|jgi:hypothetical protein